MTSNRLHAALSDAKSQLGIAAGTAENIAEWRNLSEEIDPDTIKADVAETAALLARLLDATGRAALRFADTIDAASERDRSTFTTMRNLAGQLRAVGREVGES